MGKLIRFCSGGAVLVGDIVLKQGCHFINQSTQTFVAQMSPGKPGSGARQPNQCSTANSMKPFRNNGPSGLLVSMGGGGGVEGQDSPSQRDVFLCLISVNKMGVMGASMD